MNTGSEEENIKIQKTANVLYDLRDHTDYKFCREIADFLIEKTGGSEGDRLLTENLRAFPVSRFETNHKFLELMAKKYGKDLQIIELGAGFSPHFLNLNFDIGKYIEVEFSINSKLKEEITRKLTDKENINFIAGDILSNEVWGEIINQIDINKPVLVFSEGVIAQYFNSEQKETVASYIKPLLIHEGSCFVIDDTLRNHPELQDNPTIKEGMNRVVSQSGSNLYKNDGSTPENEFDRWNRLFNNQIYTIDYVLSKPEMDFAIKSFKSTVCINDKNKDLSSPLSELSNQNKNNRIWK